MHPKISFINWWGIQNISTSTSWYSELKTPPWLNRHFCIKIFFFNTYWRYFFIFKKLVFTVRIICLMDSHFTSIVVQCKISFILCLFLENWFLFTEFLKKSLNWISLIAHCWWKVSQMIFNVFIFWFWNLISRLRSKFFLSFSFTIILIAWGKEDILPLFWFYIELGRLFSIMNISIFIFW